jgi:hypothetical protein
MAGLSRHQSRIWRYSLLALTLGLAIVATLAATTLAATDAPSKGIIPEAAFRPGQDIDYTLVPDFVPALGRDGETVGYVSKVDLANRVGSHGERQVKPVPVFADDLETLVGYMVLGKGFVPLGTDPASIPDFPSVAEPGDAGDK